MNAILDMPTFMKYDKEGAANNKQDGFGATRVIVSNPDSMIYEIAKFYSPPLKKSTKPKVGKIIKGKGGYCKGSKVIVLAT
jgi:hypothetical protein